MENEKLPIKFFAPREVDELKVEGAGSSEPPKWVLTGEELAKRSSDLLSSFAQFTDNVAEREKRNSAVPFVFIAKMNDNSTAKSRRKDINSLFQTTDKSSIIGLANTDELIVKLDSVSQMNEISSKLQNYQQNSYAISCLETFKEFRPYIELDDTDSSYKVKLIDFQDYEINISLQRLFERTMMCYNKVVTPPKSAIINTGGKSNGKLQRRIQEKDSAYALGRRTDDKKSVGGVPRFRERDRILA